MKTFNLAATSRKITGKAVGTLRRSGRVPAVVYGGGNAVRNLEVEAVAFGKIYAAAGESSLVDLAVDAGAPTKALIQDVQHDPVTGKVIHADFRAVKMTEKLKAEVPVVFVGESPAVKESGGVLVKSLGSIEVECLPGDLVHEIEVPLVSLKQFGDLTRLRDLTPPPGIVFVNDPETVVVSVAAPRSEEELKSLEGAVEVKVEEVGVVEKKKKEEEEAAPEGEEKKKEAK
ncbi:hypothetical protein A3F28_01700 [Candidatus Uhrbacteria bacterium RIFCSPHIGHO2_12_FULL_57_11]|uniref:Large ribosomal subunit protein bL25 n=2 Tax=Candidatus Uhriibacteriota TaxID=1752732 RepID=A0A1F7UJZ6_9BACT|nr:MAG: hypothetical protein A3D72_02685 [Candidatus Uhrbacteria bacterium RIFCSPHIGHO2_02_FULL_57_19]OGL78600.1 MAG: hypothetical protein A3F28_01700 [Candidatus Uhrbacteria bacterium RIFCSPHIGHO2_12_FULL_57_11]